jgi:hypothetical protein
MGSRCARKITKVNITANAIFELGGRMNRQEGVGKVRRLLSLFVALIFALVIRLLAVPCFAGWVSKVSAVPQGEAPVPTIASASVPFYPRIAQTAHIEGAVKLRLSTDGKVVSAVEVEAGPAMLVQAAKENVNTWRFERHRPTKFETTFHYKLLPSICGSKCNCGSVEGPSVILHIPINVEINADEILTCDPAIERKPQ